MTFDDDHLVTIGAVAVIEVGLSFANDVARWIVVALDLDAARQSIADKIARPLNVDLLRAAWGIHQVVNENMANVARMHLVEKGSD